MTVEEVKDLLKLVQVFDRRPVGAETIVGWSAALDDIEPAAARDAVVAWYREHREWVSPADIRRLATPAKRPTWLPPRSLETPSHLHLWQPDGTCRFPGCIARGSAYGEVTS